METIVATHPIRKNEPPAETGRHISSSISPEHRAILEAALASRKSPSFNEILASIPDVGLDADFERNRD